MKKSNYISIKQYLENRGLTPVKDRGYYGLYHSPLREDTNPSFKVDYKDNLWYDFGTSQGGSIVDLVMKLENCTLAEAFKKLDDSFSFHRNGIVSPVIPAVQESTIKIQHIVPLTHPALLSYLNERSIDIDIAKCHCRQVHYSIKNNPYFAIGFKNDAGGWELRNRSFKGCCTPKEITTLNNGSNTVIVFEGFIDFLSYLTIKRNPSPAIDTAVLNSTANLNKAIPFLKSYRTIHTFLDNDTAGQKTVEQLQQSFPASEVINHSSFYKDYKDLNDYWQNKSPHKTHSEAQEIEHRLGRKL